MSLPSAIAKAIAFADMPDYEGAGYTLLVRDVTGQETEVDVYRHATSNSSEMIVLRVRKPDHDEDRREIFFQPENVASVCVLW